MTNSADKNKKPGPQRSEFVAQPADRIGQLVFALAILQEIFIWGFATMSCWAMNSVKSELDLREFYNSTAVHLHVQLYTFLCHCESLLGHFRSGQKVWCCRDQNYISQVSRRQNMIFHSFFCQELYVFACFWSVFIFWFTSLGPFLSRWLCFGLEIRYIAVLSGLVFGLHISGLQARFAYAPGQSPPEWHVFWAQLRWA